MEATEKFLIEQNLRNFRRLLGTELNVGQRWKILELLAGEERKLLQCIREAELLTDLS